MTDLSPLLAPPWPAPTHGDQDTMDVILDDALAALAAARRLAWLGDGATQLHLCASLHAALEQRIAESIELARDQDLDWETIAALAGTTITHARQLIDDHPEEDELDLR